MYKENKNTLHTDRRVLWETQHYSSFFSSSSQMPFHRPPFPPPCRREGSICCEGSWAEEHLVLIKKKQVVWTLLEEEYQAGERRGGHSPPTTNNPTIHFPQHRQQADLPELCVVCRGFFWSWAWGLPQLLSQQWQTCVWFLRRAGVEEKGSDRRGVS